MHPRHQCDDCQMTRRDFVSTAVKTLGLGVGLPLFLRETNLALAADTLAGVPGKHPERILVVLELAGGNDGLNTVIPYSNDEYYRLRPTLGIAKERVLKLSDEFGFHPNLLGWKSQFKEGHLAVVHGCGYPNPDRSHFVSMSYWHSANPHGSESHGWVGRFADQSCPAGTPSYVVNIAAEQSAAVGAGVHSPVVFKDPNRFVREGSNDEQAVFTDLLREKEKGRNQSLEFIRSISSTAASSSEFIRNACAEYRSKSDYGYGEVGADLRRVAAMIAAGSPTRIYYCSFGGFDTHGSQLNTHAGLFNQVGDAVNAFLNDVKKLGRANDVAMMMFTEFGRRVKENASFGTDHGVASPMFLVGEKVKGGLYGQHPSLTDLDQGDLKMTTDFRRVYATMMKEWMGFDDTKSVLRGDYETLGAFVS